ncbi:ABC transporter permease [Salinisphaera sp. Q1T1-3]|uniref:ABC transporter permease n=1 Tax=Salinisphaera sp. Q1T1-3 TaxID=2321229 RepID=UPI000E70FEDF|nr:ABC transporter permease [Salinisphaera sp. Q1T1-3]
MHSPVLRLIGRQLGSALITLILVSLVIFAITSLLPGDTAKLVLGQFATPDQVAALRAKLGLDQPAPLRYLHWLGGLMTGHLGVSASNDMPVSTLIAQRLPASLLLAGITTLVSVPLALGIGMISAMYRGRLADSALNVVTLAMVAIPDFLVAILLILLFAVHLGWLPALSYISSIHGVGDFLRVYAMPVATLCTVLVAQMARMTRIALINELDSAYIEMARLKGIGPVRCVLVHALPNAIGPIANAIALSLSYLMGGIVIVETIFNYPGLASLMVDAVSNQDLPLVQACAMLFCAFYLLLILLAELAALLANPKLRTR